MILIGNDSAKIIIPYGKWMVMEEKLGNN